ncbi:MAG: DNA primase [Bacteroidota bacterium]
MISKKTIQEIVETARIEDVVQDFVNLKRRGANMLGLCPFHNEKTPSFTVSPGKNIYKCFGCGKGGDPVNFIMEHESFSYPEALKYLAKKYGIEVDETQRSPEQRAEQQLQDSLYLINEYARDFYQDQLFNTDKGKSIGLNYFKERGFREETIQRFGLGFAPDKKDAFTLKAVNTGYKLDLLKNLGLTSKYGSDFFRNRVMFTIHNLSGKVIGFGGRIMVKNVKAPKYVNSPETEIYNKSKVLYGAYFAKRAIRKQDECILVEGYTDVISLHQAGIENVVASSGTSLTVDQIRLVKRYTPNMKILYDGDPAGIKAALRGLDLVLEQDMNVKVVLLPEGEDPDSYLQKVGTAAFTEYIDQNADDFILFKTNLLMKEAATDPVKKAALIKDLVSSIARIPDPLKRSVYVKQCAATVGVEEQLLVNEANKILSSLIQKKRRDEAIKERRQNRQATQNQKSEDHHFPGVDSAPPPEAEQLLPPEATPAVSPSETQERDIIRILITLGNKVFDEKENITVAGFVLSNIEDVLHDFDNKLYEKIAREYLQMVVEEKKIDSNYFINHPDPQIQALTISLLHSPFEMSPNWIDLHDLPLRTQPMPELNFNRDSIQAILRFKLGKVIKLLGENQNRIKSAQNAGDTEKLDKRIKVHMKLLEIRNQLAAELKTVSLK